MEDLAITRGFPVALCWQLELEPVSLFLLYLLIGTRGILFVHVFFGGRGLSIKGISRVPLSSSRIMVQRTQE